MVESTSGRRDPRPVAIRRGWSARAKEKEKEEWMNLKFDVLVLHRFDVEADGWDGGDDLADL